MEDKDYKHEAVVVPYSTLDFDHHCVQYTTLHSPGLYNPSLLFLFTGHYLRQFTDDPQHHLVRPPADTPEPQISVGLADSHLLREAHPAPELEAGVGDLPG